MKKGKKISKIRKGECNDPTSIYFKVRSISNTSVRCVIIHDDEVAEDKDWINLNILFEYII